MAGRPKKRAREAAAAAGTDVVPAATGGNGVWRSFAEMTPEQRREAQAKSVEARQRRRLAKQLADDQAYLEVHREHGLEILETRLEIVRSLKRKGTAVEVDASGNPTGRTEFDATLLDKDERKTLMDALDVLDKRGRGGYTQRLQVEQNVSVVHEVARINAALAKGERVELTPTVDDEDAVEIDDADWSEEE